VRFTLLLCLLLAPGIALAQDSPSFSVEAAVSTAIRNNPRLAAAVREIAAAAAGARSARALQNPTLFVAPALGNINGTTEELLLLQPLELNGTRTARSRIAAAQLRIAQSESVIELRNTVAATKTAYYELTRAREQLALARSLLETAEAFDRATRRLVELGSRPGIDQTQTSLEVARAQQQVLLAESQAAIASATLNTLLGRAPETPIGPLSPLTNLEAVAHRATELPSSPAARAEIQAAQAARDRLQQEAQLARAEGLPDLAPQFRVQQFGTSQYGFSLVITLPLLDWGSRRDRVRQAEESARAQEARIAAVQNQIRQEIAQAQLRAQAAEQVVQTYRQGALDAAKRLLEGRQKAFQAGAADATVLSVLEAQRAYRGVQSEYINALVSLAQARAELERATGAMPASLLREAALPEGKTK
jgi:outer membrane protein TolC